MISKNMNIKLCFLLLVISNCAYSQCPNGSVVIEKNLVSNGDFEDNKAIFESDYIRRNSEGAGSYCITENAFNFSKEYFIGKGDGKFMAVDGADGFNMTVWKQTLKVKAHTDYFFSCWVSTLNVRTGPPAVLQFSINNVLLDKPFHCPKSLNKWEQFAVSWNSGDAELISIRIVSQNPDLRGNDFGLDRIRFYECQTADLKIEENKAIALRNLVFKTNSAEIIESSFTELDELVNYLAHNKDKTIVISGHTDNIGSEDSNLTLSEQRAMSVMKYLTQNGIESNRITFSGYGELKPIASNETIEGRQNNRRVEFIIK